GARPQPGLGAELQLRAGPGWHQPRRADVGDGIDGPAAVPELEEVAEILAELQSPRQERAVGIGGIAGGPQILLPARREGPGGAGPVVDAGGEEVGADRPVGDSIVEVPVIQPRDDSDDVVQARGELERAGGAGVVHGGGPVLLVLERDAQLYMFR